MARFVVGVVAGILITTVAGAATGLHAQSDDVESAAAEAGVDAQDLRGALNSTGISDARQYLRGVGELPSPKPAVVSVSSARAACIIAHESRNDPRAVNARTGAAGLGQFLGSTWRSTPQGRAGLSVFDASANRAAVEWMLAQGRAREFSVVTSGLC